MSRRERKLYRDTENDKIGGVCSGLARYFDLDPLLVRVAFVAALTFGGGSLIAYVLLWWLLDPAPAGYWADTDQTEANTEAVPPPAGPAEQSETARAA
jgi:phage shock protein C